MQQFKREWKILALHLCACTHCSPSGKPSGLQACTHTVEVAKREQLPTAKERKPESLFFLGFSKEDL